jgi:hypothetical protein
MPSKEFVDSNGVAWRVWSTVPTGGAVRVAKFTEGWLTFESGEKLRRLAPLPPNWENATVERLELMCRAANEVKRHTGPFRRAVRDEPGPGSDEDTERPMRR